MLPPTKPPDPAPKLRSHQKPTTYASQCWLLCAHLEPNDALARLHGGIIKVSLLLL